MGRLGIGALLLLVTAECCLGSTKITPEQIFRDMPRIPNNGERWNNPSLMSQAAPQSLSAATAHPLAFLATSASAESYAIANAYAGVYDERISDLIASNVLRFAHDIGQQLSENALYSKCEVFSPASIMSALSMLMLGARGRSFQELKQILGLDADAELRNNPSKYHEEFGYMLEDVQRDENGLSSVQRLRKTPEWRRAVVKYDIRNNAGPQTPYEHIVKVANGVFTQSGSYSLNPNYRFIIQSVYHAELDELDFQYRPELAREHINAWVYRNTFGKIPNIISDDIPKGTNAILTSALYFKGFWENDFFESATILDDFYPDGPERRGIKVQMMATGGVFPFYDAKEYNCRIIGLPYKGNVTTMYVIQPNNSTRAKLKDLQKYLDAPKIEDMIAKMEQKTSLLALPKMHFMRSINMKSMLNRLGVNDIFINGYSDLSLIGAVQRYAVPPVPAAMAPLASPASGTPQQLNNLSIRTNSQQDLRDRYQETPLIFNGWSGLANTRNYTNSTSQQRSLKLKRQITYPLITNSLNSLEALRYASPDSLKSDLFVEDILHKVDFNVNEHGTEAAAATITYLRRSGTDVLFRADTPFLVLIRHDPTKLVLFYGIINEPVL